MFISRQIRIAFFLVGCILHYPGIAQRGYIPQNTQLNFQKFSVKEGLSQSSANAFFQDKHGFMWIGTIDGLNRFDGVQFKTYKTEDGLSHNNVMDMTEDADGNLWIATTIGLNKYNFQTETFTKYLDSTSHNFYNKIIIDENNKRLWLAANDGGVKYLDLSTNRIQPLSTFIYNDSQAKDILRISDDEILISTYSSGVFKLNINSLKVEPFLNDTTSMLQLPNNKIWKMLKVKDQIYLASGGDGLIIFDLKTKKHKVVNEGMSNLSTDFTYRLGTDAQNNILVGTDGAGLNIISPTFDVIGKYQKSDIDPKSISSDVIRGIYTDRENNLWIGTYNGGFNYVNMYNRYMMHFKKEVVNPNSISNSNVTCFVEGDDETIWIGTDKGGLNYWKNGQFGTIDVRKQNTGIIDNVIMCMAKAPNGGLLIGGYSSGLTIYKDGQFENYANDINDSTSISEDWIWEIDVDKTGNYWIGAYNGLNKFDPITKTFTRFKASFHATRHLPVNSIRSLLIDRDGTLWVGSYGGLGKFSLEEESYEYFFSTDSKENGLPNNIIVEIFEDSKDQLWIGTYGGGLALLNKDSETFEVFTEKDGFPSNLIQSIEEDDHGNLWISTVKGMVKFNYEKKHIQILDESSGLQGEVFKHNSSMKDKDGFMYFGGINGFNVFHPDSIQFPEINNPIVLTDFQIFNESIKPAGIDGILEKSISFTEDITLSYDDSRFFTVHFTLPNFTSPNKLKFAYMLDGFDDDWIYIKSERKVTFTNLDPGNYELKIRQSADNFWTDNYISLNIRIVPPFYMRREFVGLMMLLAGLSVFGFVRYRTTNYRKRQEELERLVDEQNKEISSQNKELKSQNDELTKAHEELGIVNSSLEEKVERRTIKLKETIDQLNKSVNELDRFVYSASHDISAPLKSIKGLVNIARIENNDDNLVVHLDYIENSIKKLEEVIGDLIQFSRNARSELTIVDIPLPELIHEIMHSLKYLTSTEELSYEIDIPDDVVVRSDQQRLQMVFHNLLTNAIKYRDEEKLEQWVKVHYTKTETHWSLDIKDNGIGIPEEHVDKVFQMFYRATESSDGTGLGLYIVKEAIDKLGGTVNLDSEENIGTHFKVTLPIDPKRNE